MLISVITMFFIAGQNGILSTFLSVTILTAAIILSIIATFSVTKLLSKTILKGMPSSFTLELPPYRKPQIGKVIVRSIFDRTLFVLGRAAAVAAPAGLVIWVMANAQYGGDSLLTICSQILDPIGRLMGLDGVILIAFILGFPANEIVVPIIIMSYMASGAITELGNLSEIQNLFVSHGWSLKTALCFIIFTIMHWPCSTTLLTIKKETGSIKWTFLAAAIPTLTGILLCIVVNLLFKLI